MNNMKKAMVFGIAMLMVLTIFAAMPAPTKAANSFTLFGFIYNTDGSMGDSSTPNSYARTTSYRQEFPTDYGHFDDVYDADPSTPCAAYDYSDHGTQWSNGAAEGQHVCLIFEVKDGVNSYSGGNQSGGSTAVITHDDIVNSETDLPDSTLNDLPDPTDDGAGNMIWDAFNDANGTGILSGYTIYESADNSDGSYTAFHWVAAGTTSYALSNLNANHYYKIGFSYLYGYNTTVMSDVPYLYVVHNPSATITDVSPASPSNDNTPDFTYSTAYSPTSVDIYYSDDGGSTWTLLGTDSDADGSWTATTALADGTYDFSAVANGNTSADPLAAEGPTGYVVDTTPPGVSSVSPADGSTAAVNADVSVTFNEDVDTSVNPTLTQTAGNTVTYTAGSWNGNTFTWTHTDWSYDDSITLSVNGAKDVAGNTMTSAYSWSFNTAHDNMAPAVTMGSISDVEGGNTQTITATVDDSGQGDSNIQGATYTVIAPSGMVAIDNASMDASDGNFDEVSEDVTASFSTVGWAPGTYTVYVFGSDVQSNTGSAHTTYSETDNNAPTMDSYSPSDGATVQAGNDIVVTVHVEDQYDVSNISGVTLYYAINGSSTYTSVPMAYKDQGVDNTVRYVAGRWTASIPAQSDGSTVDYYVTSSDESGNSATGGHQMLNVSSTTLQNPFTVYGYVWIYNGNGGTYNRLVTDATVYIQWMDSDGVTVHNESVTTDSHGRYQHDLYNYTDGGDVVVTAVNNSDTARYNVNTTVIDVNAGGSMVNVTYGIPYMLEITAPNNGAQIQKNAAFDVNYTIYDIHGVIAPGYFGTVHLVSGDSLATMPSDYTFGGIGVDDGTATVQAKMGTAGWQYLNATDTAHDVAANSPHSGVNIWWDQIDIEVVGPGFRWDLTQPGWHVVGVTQTPIASNDTAGELAAYIHYRAGIDGVTINQIILANRTSSNPSTYNNTFIYGSSAVGSSDDFPILPGAAYWVYVDVGLTNTVLIQANNVTSSDGMFTKQLFQGWNMVSIAHNDSVGVLVNGGHVMFADDGGTNTVGIDTDVMYHGTPWYISYWNVGSQNYDTYIYKFGFDQPTDPQNHVIDIYGSTTSGATGFWLYVDRGSASDIAMSYSLEA